MNTCPVGSLPRRPALPAICVYSCGRRSRHPSLDRFVSEVNMTAFAGMLTPTANVSVAISNLTCPKPNMSSTASLRIGTIPEWCMAMPRRMSDLSMSYSGLSICSLLLLRERTLLSNAASAAAESSDRLHGRAVAYSWTSLRENTKHIAGNSP